MKTGVLLINLGTPEAADVASVRRYLQEFLSDARVIDLPAPLRYLLLYAFILPFRPKQSAHAYQSIWTEEGSPLLINSTNLSARLTEELGSAYTVVLGMRYGKPDLKTALDSLRHCARLIILPLYPQYASSSTGSSIEAVLKHIAGYNIQANLHIIRDFYNHPAFINAQAELINTHIKSNDFVLFSYHGIPERHIIKGGCAAVCDKACPDSTADMGCYRSQCFATTRALATASGLTAQQYSSSFQSRLGKTPWIKPYTDEVLPLLYQQGIKNLAVVCPSFVADCLETLEEMGIRAREQWLALGGESFTLVPCVNSTDLWVQGLSRMIHSTVSEPIHPTSEIMPLPDFKAEVPPVKLHHQPQL